MITKLIKYRLLLIFIILIICTIFVESPYNGSYFGTSPILFYFFVTFSNLFIYLIPKDKFIISEKILYSILVSIISLICGTVFIEIILGYIYGHDSYYYELQSPAILNSFLFYFSTSLLGLGMFSIWLKYRKPIY